MVEGTRQAALRAHSFEAQESSGVAAAVTQVGSALAPCALVLLRLPAPCVRPALALNHLNRTNILETSPSHPLPRSHPPCVPLGPALRGAARRCCGAINARSARVRRTTHTRPLGGSRRLDGRVRQLPHIHQAGSVGACCPSRRRKRVQIRPLPHTATAPERRDLEGWDAPKLATAAGRREGRTWPVSTTRPQSGKGRSWHFRGTLRPPWQLRGIVCS
jgi:hypothetical protein